MTITQNVVLKEEGATLWRWYEVRTEKRFDQPFMKDQRSQHQLVLSSSAELVFTPGILYQDGTAEMNLFPA